MMKTLIGPVVDAYNRFAKSVFTPIVDALIKLPWFWRALLFLVIVFGGLAIEFNIPISAGARRAWLFAAHSLGHPDNDPSLTKSGRTSLMAMRESLVSYLQSEVFKLHDPNWQPDPWALAQMAVALGDELPESELVIQYLEASVAPDLGWGQPQGESVSHLGASGWIIFALGTLRRPLRQEQYEFFLTSQNPEGWWPQFAPGKNVRENASTYATVWQLIGLNEHLRKSLVDRHMRESVRVAIDRGYAWLEQQDEGANPLQRWTDYPLESGEELSPNEREMLRESVTSLVLHCLHTLKPRLANNSLRGFDSRWLHDLPTVLPLPSSSGRTDHWVNWGGIHKDDLTRHYRLPWLLIGVMDAYPNGSISDHVAANDRLEAFFQNGHRYIDDVRHRNWIAAEFLYALNNIQHGINHRVRGKG